MIDSTWEHLATDPEGSEPPTAFDPESLIPLPSPAARWLGRCLRPGTPLVDAAIIAMTGEIKIGSRWMPFTARQIIRAGVGFVWRPVVGRRLIRFVGADLLYGSQARMEFRLHGLIPVARAAGPDTMRSAAGRLAAETVAWLPQAVSPQAGAPWTGHDDHRAVVTVDTPIGPVDVEVTVDDEGRLETIDLQRWNASIDQPAEQPFGADLGDDFETTAGVRIAGSGAVGWGHGTSEWPEGEFFRYSITDLRPLGP